jgi:hypothetical protein
LNQNPVKSQTSERGVEKVERNVGRHERTEENRIKDLVPKQDRQCTYDVTLRRVRVTIVAVQKQ